MNENQKNVVETQSITEQPDKKLSWKKPEMSIETIGLTQAAGGSPIDGMTGTVF